MRDNPLQEVIDAAVAAAIDAVLGPGTSSGPGGGLPPAVSFPLTVTTASTVDNGTQWPFMIGYDAIGDDHAVIRAF